MAFKNELRICLVTQVLFIIFKGIGILKFSWWLVLMPVWLPVVLLIGLFLLGIIAGWI